MEKAPQMKFPIVGKKGKSDHTASRDRFCEHNTWLASAGSSVVSLSDPCFTPQTRVQYRKERRSINYEFTLIPTARRAIF